MSQEIIEIDIEDLVLWTENPRDPINVKATDQDVVNRAVSDTGSKWSLGKLVKEMGPYYDLSELPTVVLHGKTPIVYDGNRRMVLAKIKHGLVKVDDFDVDLPEFPRLIPCNVCSKDIALQNVYRKHSDTGSWLPLERDIFAHKHMKEPKSHFLSVEESTGLISANPHLNQRFVKEEIFRDDIFNKLGFCVQGNMLVSRHTSAQATSILDDLSDKIKNKKISTRNNRGKVLEVLSPDNQRIIDTNKRRSYKQFILNSSSSDSDYSNDRQRITKRVRSRQDKLFGGSLYLRMGNVSNLYRDIADLENFYRENKKKLSEYFPSLIRMSLRLICETAAKESKQGLENYLKTKFNVAKAKLDQDKKTALSNHNVTESSIVQLLHTGAHNYSASANWDQTLALSLILGEILTISHGKAEEK